MYDKKEIPPILRLDARSKMILEKPEDSDSVRLKEIVEYMHRIEKYPELAPPIKEMYIH